MFWNNFSSIFFNIKLLISKTSKFVPLLSNQKVYGSTQCESTVILKGYFRKIQRLESPVDTQASSKEKHRRSWLLPAGLQFRLEFRLGSDEELKLSKILFSCSVTICSQFHVGLTVPYRIPWDFIRFCRILYHLSKKVG